jgi:hypothetical protein
MMGQDSESLLEALLKRKRNPAPAGSVSITDDYVETANYPANIIDSLMIAYSIADSVEQIAILVMLWNHRMKALNGAQHLRAVLGETAAMAMSLDIEAQQAEGRIRRLVRGLQAGLQEDGYTAAGVEQIRAEIKRVELVFGEMLRQPPTSVLAS